MATQFDPLPLSELMLELRSRNLAIGVRQFLLVGKLLDRWHDIEIKELKNALAALIARNPCEASQVKDAFDQFYKKHINIEGISQTLETLAAPEHKAGLTQTINEIATGQQPEERISMTQRLRSYIKFGLRARWYFWVLLLLALLAGSYFGYKLYHPDTSPEKAPFPPPPPPVVSSVDIPAPPQPPSKTDVEQFQWKQVAAVAASLGLLSALPFYLFRLRRLARSEAYREWSYQVDKTDGTFNYPINTTRLIPPYTKHELDDIASVLSRSVKSETGDELDVDKTLDRTLRSGMFPQIVLRTRATPVIPVLILIDEGEETKIWDLQIQALLDGLSSRGVYTDVWKFRRSADKVYSSNGAIVTLRQLRRWRAESALLVISAGEGILEASRRDPAPWVAALKYWRARAWLHPVADSNYWRSSIKLLPMEAWPMTGKGILAAARQIARGDSQLIDLQSAKAPAERPVTPLDVDLLRSLLNYFGRKDPTVLELLRQKFYPGVPKAAVLEALIAPPLEQPLAIGRKPDDIRAYLIDLLKESKPKDNPLANLHWRLDVALQQLHLPEERKTAVEELKKLADEPVMGYVQRALVRLLNLRIRTGQIETPDHDETNRNLRDGVVKRIEKNIDKQQMDAFLSGRMNYSTRPLLKEVLIPILIAGVILTGLWTLGRKLPLLETKFWQKVPQTQYGYDLVLKDNLGEGDFGLEIRALQGSPSNAQLWGGERVTRNVDLSNGNEIRLDAQQRGRWYYVSGKTGSGIDRRSNMVFVPDPAQTDSWLLVKFIDRKGRNLDPVDYHLTRGQATDASTAHYTLPEKYVKSYFDGRSGQFIKAQAGHWKLTASPDIQHNIALAPNTRDDAKPTVITVGQPVGALLFVQIEPKVLNITPGGSQTVTYYFQDQGDRNLTVSGWTAIFLSRTGRSLGQEKRISLPYPISVPAGETRTFNDNIYLPEEVVLTPKAAASYTERAPSLLFVAEKTSTNRLLLTLVHTFVAVDDSGKQLTFPLRIPISVVQLGPGSVTVPGLIGMSEKQAISTLSKTGLNSSTSYESSSNIANQSVVQQGQSRVISQNPQSGAVVPHGATVEIVLGPERGFQSAPFTKTFTSGQKASGLSDSWSDWYRLCSDEAPPGYAIGKVQFTLRGDRSCGAWSECRRSEQSSAIACWEFRLQGHSEWIPPRVGYSEGVLQVTFVPLTGSKK